MNRIKLKATIRKFGPRGYHIYVPAAFVKSGNLEEGKEYVAEVLIPSPGDSGSTDLRGGVTGYLLGVPCRSAYV